MSVTENEQNEFSEPLSEAEVTQQTQETHQRENPSNAPLSFREDVIGIELKDDDEAKGGSEFELAFGDPATESETPTSAESPAASVDDKPVTSPMSTDSPTVGEGSQPRGQSPKTEVVKEPTSTPSESIRSKAIKKGISKEKSNIAVRKSPPKPAVPSNSLPNPTSSIPVKVAKPASKMSMRSITNPPTSKAYKSPKPTVNKHTLEIQFMNKHKRLMQYKKELMDKQRPVMDLYQNLLDLKKQLAEFGKDMVIEEIKLLPCSTMPMRPESGDKEPVTINAELLQSMKSSIEQIPKTLMDICHNLINRRSAIVDILESVSQADIQTEELSDKVGTLKKEGKELKKSLDVVMSESQKKIAEVIADWHAILQTKNTELSSMKVVELENLLKEKENQLKETNKMAQEMQRRLDERRGQYDKAVSEAEIITKEYTEKIQKLEQELENEKKTANDQKSKTSGYNQTIKSLRSRLTDLESKTKEGDSKTNEATKKLKLAQEQLRIRENQWNREKEEMQKTIKAHEKKIQKLTQDNSGFQSRLDAAECNYEESECVFKKQIKDLQKEIGDLTKRLEEEVAEKEEIKDKNEKMEKELIKLSNIDKQTMNTCTKLIDWVKPAPGSDVQTELYSELLATKVTLREYEEKMRQYEKEATKHMVENEELQQKLKNLVGNPTITRQEEALSQYRSMLLDSEKKLNEKAVEIAKLTAEIKHLKVRQDALEEQSTSCTTEELKRMVDEGRAKLSEVMKKSMENEQKMSVYETTIEKQQKQMNEMENLLRVRDGLIGMIKAKKDELIMEKDSMTRYCKDVRSMLSETREDLQIKAEIIKELQEKLDKKEKQCILMDKRISELEETLTHTNEKRFKLQDTIGTMEKELQSTKAHVNQLAELQSRYDLGMTYDPSNSIIDVPSKQNPTLLKAFSYQNGDYSFDVPIREMDLIRRKLFKLSKFQMPSSPTHKHRHKSKANNAQTIINTLQASKSLQAVDIDKSPYERMIEIEAKRYEMLQKQTDDTYENLNYLLRLPLSDKSIADQPDKLMMGDEQLAPDKLEKSPSIDDTNLEMEAGNYFLADLSETYKDLNEYLKLIKDTLLVNDEAIEDGQKCAS